MRLAVTTAIAAVLLNAGPITALACADGEHSGQHGNMGKGGHGDMIKMREMRKMMKMKFHAQETPAQSNEKTPEPAQQHEHGT